MTTIQKIKKTAALIVTLSSFCNSFLIANEELPSQAEERLLCQNQDRHSPNALSLADLINAALENNPETRNAWWKARQSAALYGKTKSACYPTITYNGNVTHGHTYKFINGPQATYTTSTLDLNLYYLLFDFGERKANIESARAALEAANWRTNWIFQKIISKVFMHAYEYWNAYGILQARERTLLDIQKNLEAAEQQYKTGLKSITDVYAVKTTYADMRMTIANQRANVDIAKGKLTTSIGLNADEKIEIMALDCPIPLNFGEGSLRELIDRAQSSRADIMSKRAEVWQRQAALRKVSKSAEPKISFSGKAGYQQYYDDKDHGYQYRASLNIDFPLFNGFDTIYQTRAAYADERAAAADYEQLELDISLEVLAALRKLEASQEAMSLSKENLQNAVLTYEGVLDKYKVGTQSIFDLNKAQQMLSDARIKDSEAKTQFYLAISQLALASGTLETLAEGICTE